MGGVTLNASGCTFGSSKYMNYCVGGNICNAFVLGNPGSKDDFFLVAAPPPGESSFPSLTGNILDSEGNVLFRLVNNILTLNPGHCSKISGNRIGYSISDSTGNPIFSVETRFEKTHVNPLETWVTTITANLYDKGGNRVVSAEGPGGTLVSTCKTALGWSGNAFGITTGMTERDLRVASLAIATGGAIHELVDKDVSGGEFWLDGKYLSHCIIGNAVVHVETGTFLADNAKFAQCKFAFHGVAESIKNIVLGIVQQSGGLRQ